MDSLEKMLTGELHVRDYLELLRSDPSLQAQLRNLVPQEARGCPAHPLWKRFSYTAFSDVNFDLLAFLRRICRFDGSLGDNLNVYSSISGVYQSRNPALPLTNVYEEAFDLLLDACGERFGGPEVDALIDALIQETLKTYKTKKDRKQQAKAQLNALFHVTDRRTPSWLHGPEWPMGQNSPMRYLSSTRSKDRESKIHLFQDVDTGAVRQIVEYY